MRRAGFVYLLVVLLLTASLLPVVAQDDPLPEVYTTEQGVSFRYPSGWRLLPEHGLYLIDNSTDSIYLLVPEFLADNHIDGETPAALLAGFFAWAYDDLAFDAEAVWVFDLDGREAARYDYRDASGRAAMALAVTFSDGTRGLLGAHTTADELERDLVLAVAASFDRFAFPHKHTFANGYTVRHPEGWEAFGAGLRSAGAVLVFSWYTDLDPVQALARAAQEAGDAQYDPARAVFVMVNGQELARYDFEAEEDGERYQYMLVAHALEDGRIVLAAARPSTGYELFADETVLAIVASVQAPEPSPVPPPTEVPLSETYMTGSGASFRYPASWYIDFEGDDVVVDSGADYAYMNDSAWLADKGVEGETVAEVLKAFFAGQFQDDLAFDPDRIQIINLEGRRAARYDYIHPDGTEAMLLVIPFSDGGFGVVNAYTYRDDMAAKETLLRIAATFDR